MKTRIVKGILFPLVLEGLLLLFAHHLWRNVETPWLNTIFSVGLFNLFFGVGELLNDLGCTNPMSGYNSMSSAVGQASYFAMSLDRLNDPGGEKYNRRNSFLSNISVRTYRLITVFVVAAALLVIAYSYYQSGYWDSLIS